MSISLWNRHKKKQQDTISYIQKLSSYDDMENPHKQLFDERKQEALAHGLEANERLTLIGYQGTNASGKHKQPLIYDFEWLKKDTSIPL